MHVKSCGHCGAPADEDGDYCSACGKRLDSAAVNSFAGEPRVSRNPFIITMVLISLGCVALGFLAGMRFDQWRGSQRKLGIAVPEGVRSSLGVVADVKRSPSTEPVPEIVVENDTRSSTARSDDFELSITRCAHNGSAVVCQLMITNLSDDRGVGFSRGCARIIDGAGNEFLVQRYQLGHDTAGAVGSWINMKLVSGIPMKLELDFGEESAKVGSIRLLQVVFNGAGRKQGLKFRDVALSR